MKPLSIVWLCAVLVIFNQRANSQDAPSPKQGSADKSGENSNQPPTKQEMQLDKLPDGAAKRAAFVQEAKKLVMGDTCEDVAKILANQNNIFTMNSNHDRFGFTAYLLPDGIYCVYLTLPPSNPAGHVVRDCPCDKVEVLRLPLPQPKPKGLNAYIHNFLDFLISDRSKSDGIQCELIYSDPPPKPDVDNLKIDPKKVQP
ncbi:MAG TPA: hypothetical protein VMJ32_04365 [Pirellulales bacterium]|nr:hypothetical protein [Pirellulales bacterium]